MSETIPFKEWQKFEFVVGQIKEIKDHPKADKLYLIKVDIGEKVIQLVAGLREVYTPKDLKNKKVIVFKNLEPVVIRGEKSEGMVLAAEKEGKVALLTPDNDIELGARVK